ncbi:C-terminal binding protein [Halobacterium salinarum]|uniref:C-terminal binding protein n=1 Tax=Halobacterium salinarum TaxID=2242 RepID=UPI002557BB67|nr:C-terminal binding protein [Halobacterium salinarum]MDL0122815.1 C-terminal binding protein [Halobacterium salinarum]MDL0141422.1 C-terminal binding protein [Halobacterium salinarum]
MFTVLVSDGMGMLGALPDAVADRATRDVAFEHRRVETGEGLVAAVDDTGADAVVGGPETPVPAETIAEIDGDVAAIVRAGVGVDAIDCAAAADHGVAVANAPSYCTREVGEHALSLVFGAARRLHEYDRQTRRGGWAWDDAPAPLRLADATVGFVGFGEIARGVADTATTVAESVIAYDPYVDAATAERHGVAMAEFEAVCAQSDVLVVFAPLTEETRGLVDEAACNRLPEGAVVVNVGRGAVVDDAALAGALEDGPVSAAALDVLPTEPPVESPLVGRSDVLVTPHCGWYSEAAAESLVASLAGTVAAVADGDGVPERTRVA